MNHRINSSNISVLHNGNPSKSRKRLGSNGSNHDGLSGRLSGGSAAALGSTVTSVPTVAPAFNVTQSLLSMTGLSSRPITLTTSRVRVVVARAYNDMLYEYSVLLHCFNSVYIYFILAAE